MIKNYLKIAFRNLIKYKVYSFINIFGLAIGMAACLVILLFIADEKSFDQFHQKKDQIYRLDEVQSFEGMSPQNVALSMPGMGPNMQNEFPEIINFSRYWNRGSLLYKKDETQLMVDATIMVDSTFLEIFDFELIQGDRYTALIEPNSLVVTEETARKFFNKTDVLGEQLLLEDDNFKITGVLANVPENSHLQFNTLVSISTVTHENPEFNNRWGSNFLVTYLQLAPNTHIANLESKFPGFLQSHMNEDVTNYYKLYLQPLSEVHLNSVEIEHDYQNYRKFDGSYVNVFLIVAFFVLLIAGINFMNLSVARSATRSKEVGIRKSVGAIKWQLIGQFLGESVLLTFVALLLSLFISAAFIPYLNAVTNRSLSMLTIANHIVLVLGIIATVGIIGLVAGSYPAFFLASFQPAKVLKGKVEGFGKKSLLRNSLVVIQFAIAITLIVGTVVAMQQLRFMKSKDVGFNKDQMMIVPMSQEANEKYETLKNELLKQPDLLGVTASGQRLGNNLHQTGAKVKTDTTVRDLSVSQINVDYNYLSVYGIKLKSGREFSKEYSTDAGFAFIVNESLAKELGLENPLGSQFGFGWYNSDTLGSIVGVAYDFNYNSLHHNINTLCMHVHPEWGFSELSVKAKGDNIQGAIAAVKSTWENLIGDRPFEYSFLDEHFESLYRSDEQMSTIISAIAGLAIIIACLGLFGLASITTEQRIKEIGIRKVLGASIGQLLVNLSKNFAFLVIIAFLISTPITYYLMREWLAGFAFRVNLSVWVFVFAGIISLLIALVTISYQTFRAAMANPVDVLKSE